MVLSIPPPSLADLLPAFLAHIPASFASPHPPPSLPPHLTPLTRSRLTHLSFNLPTSSSDSSWLSLLTWSSDPSDGQALHDHLVAQDYYFLHQAPSPGTFQCKGFRRLDAETLQALVSIPEIELLVVYQFTENDVPANGASGTENSWKVHDVRLSDDEDALLRAGSWHDSTDAAEESFRSRNYTYPTRPTVSTAVATNYQDVAADDDDDDDYWGRYDDEDTESTAGDHEQHAATASQQQSPVQLAASLLARRVLDPQPDDTAADEDAYFAQYADVQPVLDNNTSTTTTTAKPKPANINTDNRRDSLSTTHTAATDREEPTSTSLSTPLTAFTHPSTHISPLQQQSKAADVAALERAAEVHTQAEVAIRQHVSTSIKSLYRLWKAGGLDADEFARVVERDVEVLRLVEEAAELGR
ncbi:hypothetical protein TWF696_001457 [Orbilia brochopaga]|uniref:Uncharacterized protein n=1 Tax=Orbilia brochopaga TaxID=3140254 RepID=A0AAV9U8Q4_9PEZI